MSFHKNHLKTEELTVSKDMHQDLFMMGKKRKNSSCINCMMCLIHWIVDKMEKHMISMVILISHMDAESIHFTYFPLVPTNHPEPVSLLLYCPSSLSRLFIVYNTHYYLTIYHMSFLLIHSPTRIWVPRRPACHTTWAIANGQDELCLAHRELHADLLNGYI